MTNNSIRKHIIHDLQPYICTYEDCPDENRTYDSRAEWVKHEGDFHAKIWQCSEHPDAMYDSREEYIGHLDYDHPEASNESRAPEMIALNRLTISESLRDCPFCGAVLSAFDELQDHVANHLERFALLALPRLDDVEEENNGHEASSDSNHAAIHVGNHAHANSRAGDFDHTMTLNFIDHGANIEEDETVDDTPMSSDFEHLRSDLDYAPGNSNLGKADIETIEQLQANKPVTMDVREPSAKKPKMSLFESTRHHDLKSRHPTYDLEPLFACEQCSYRFWHSLDLRRHLELHIGEGSHS